MDLIKESYHDYSRITLFVDNAKWHKAKLVKEYLSKQETIELLFFVNAPKKNFLSSHSLNQRGKDHFGQSQRGKRHPISQMLQSAHQSLAQGRALPQVEIV